MYYNFEISLLVFMPNIATNHAISYTNFQNTLFNLTHNFCNIFEKLEKQNCCRRPEKAIKTQKFRFAFCFPALNKEHNITVSVMD